MTSNVEKPVVKPEKKVREPLIHITKRAYMVWWKAWCVRGIALLLSLIVCGILTILVTGLNPLEVYSSMFKGAFGNSQKTWITFRNLSILLCISLAVTPAFRMKFWNIGAEGQVLAGALAAAGCMILLGNKLPNGILIPVMIVTSLTAGALWGFLPALFKAMWNTNETLFTLMMNYAVMQLISFFTTKWEHPKGSGNIGVINLQTQAGWFPKIGNDYLLPILTVALLTVVLYVYLNYSKHGYEISVVGESENTARYVGINVKKVILRTMLLSGAICGLAGLLLVGSINHTVSTTTAGGQGFTAIMVSWLGKFNPIAMIATSFLIIFLQRGSGEITTAFDLNSSFSDILTGIILFFIIGCEFFINYQIHFRAKTKKED